jgi:hypothetical protein
VAGAGFRRSFSVAPTLFQLGETVKKTDNLFFFSARGRKGRGGGQAGKRMRAPPPPRVEEFQIFYVDKVCVEQNQPWFARYRHARGIARICRDPYWKLSSSTCEGRESRPINSLSADQVRAAKYVRGDLLTCFNVRMLQHIFFTTGVRAHTRNFATELSPRLSS